MMLDRSLSFRFPLTAGADVRAAQQALIRAGLLAAEADGVFGPHTRDAVVAWQSRRGLPADGVLLPAQFADLLPEAPAATTLAPDWREALRPFLPRSTARRWGPARAAGRWAPRACDWKARRHHLGRRVHRVRRNCVGHDTAPPFRLRHTAIPYQ